MYLGVKIGPQNALILRKWSYWGPIYTPKEKETSFFFVSHVLKWIAPFQNGLLDYSLNTFSDLIRYLVKTVIFIKKYRHFRRWKNTIANRQICKGRSAQKKKCKKRIVLRIENYIKKSVRQIVPFIFCSQAGFSPSPNQNLPMVSTKKKKIQCLAYKVCKISNDESFL